MGDRANVYVTGGGAGGVYLYTHWGGYRLLGDVRTALALRERWSDGPYLARIVFCKMISVKKTGTTGYGISSVLGDNEHPIIVLDADRRTIGLAPAPSWEAPVSRYKPKPDPEFTQPFEEFAAGPGKLDERWESA